MQPLEEMPDGSDVWLVAKNGSVIWKRLDVKLPQVIAAARNAALEEAAVVAEATYEGCDNESENDFMGDNSAAAIRALKSGLTEC